MISKIFSKTNKGGASGVLKSNSVIKYDILDNYIGNAEGLPKAPINPYRKRPVKLVYDKNEFWMFRLPSEH